MPKLSALMARTDPHTPRGNPQTARIRAAFGYADLNRPQIGARLGVSVETVSRLLAGSSTPKVDTDLLARIAEICDVPLSFLQEGFDAPAAEPTMAERVEALERKIDAVLRLLAATQPGDPDASRAKPVPLPFEPPIPQEVPRSGETRRGTGSEGRAGRP